MRGCVHAPLCLVDERVCVVYLCLGRPSSLQVKIPIVVDTLEWMLSSPPPLHQFDESPIIVEFPDHH